MTTETPPGTPDIATRHDLARLLTVGLHRMGLTASIDAQTEDMVRDVLAEALRGRAWGERSTRAADQLDSAGD